MGNQFDHSSGHAFKQRFLNSAKWILAVQVLQTVLQFIAGIVLARLILPEAFGELAYMIAVVEGASVITGIGINTSILQNKDLPQDKFQSTGFFLATLLVVLYGIIAGFIGLITIPTRIGWYLMILAAKTVFMFSGVHGILLQKDYKFQAFNLIQFGSFVFSTSTALILAFRGHGLPALVAQYVVSQVFIGAATVLASRFRIMWSEVLNWENIRRFFLNGKDLFISTLTEKWLHNADKIIITYLSGASNLAFLNKAISLNQRFTSTFISIFQPLYNVSFAELQDENERSGKLFNASLWAIVRISTLVTLVIVYTASDLIPLLYGSNWDFVIELIPYITVYVILWPVRTISRNFLLSNGEFFDVRNIQVFELVLFIGLCGMGTFVWGISGSAAALSTWSLCSVVVYLMHSSKCISLESVRIFLVPTVFYLGAMMLAPILQQASCLDGVQRVLAIITTAASVGIIGLLTFFVFEIRYVRKLIKSVRR